MSSKKLKYSNNADRKSAVHFDRQYATWVIAALKRISLGCQWKRSVFAHKNGFLSGAREKQKIPEKRLDVWLMACRGGHTGQIFRIGCGASNQLEIGKMYT